MAMASKIALSRVVSPEHALPGHPESPGRFASFDPTLKGELAGSVELMEEDIDRDDVIESIRLAHTDEYIQSIQDAMTRAPLFLDYGDTYATPQSFDSAIDAVGGTLTVLHAIQDGQNKRGFALIRPPGHHANQDQAMGFCLFNNIAIAAKTLQNNGYAKVAIYDFDVHHGNGTQDIFYDDPGVLFISSHQWGIYPGTGSKNEVGRAAGEGSTLNIPLPAYCGDLAIQQIYDQLILPRLDRFQPEFLLISAGFDAHWSDPLANLQFSTSGYHSLAKHLIRVAEQYCEGRIVFVLEGGYDPEALADNVGAVLFALADLDFSKDRLGPAPIDEPNIKPLLGEISAIHKL
jgi:acetoin utilization deacetylase AcuC-like enzyme